LAGAIEAFEIAQARIVAEEIEELKKRAGPAWTSEKPSAAEPSASRARAGRVLLGTGLGRPQNGAAKHAERRQWRRSDKRPPTNPTQRDTSPAEP
jgi:hypothetical protein